jgi:hypothetical protein
MHTVFLFHQCNLQKIKTPVILLYNNPSSFFCLSRIRIFPLSAKNKPVMAAYPCTALHLRLRMDFLKLLFKIYPGAEGRKNENTLLTRQPEYYESQYLH